MKISDLKELKAALEVMMLDDGSEANEHVCICLG